MKMRQILYQILKTKMLKSLIEKFFAEEGKPSLPEYILVERVFSEDFVVTGVKITSGEFAGLIFTSAPQVQFKPNPDGTVSLSYTYNIEVPPKDKTAMNDKPKVDKLIGDIILDIIDKNHSEGADATRNNDPIGSNEGP